MLSKLPPEEQLRIVQQLDTHSEALRAHATEAGAEARKYLWAINGGSAVALLAFMVSMPEISQSAAAWVSLGAFVLGIVALGLLCAFVVHITANNLLGWAERGTLVRTGKSDARIHSDWINARARRRDYRCDFPACARAYGALKSHQGLQLWA